MNWCQIPVFKLILKVAAFLSMYVFRITAFTHRDAHYSPPLLVQRLSLQVLAVGSSATGTNE